MRGSNKKNSNKTKNGGEDTEKVDCSYVALGNVEKKNSQLHLTMKKI